jgi:hypothetical protein
VSYGWNESTQDQPKKHRAPFFRLVSGERAGEYNPQHAHSSGAQLGALPGSPATGLRRWGGWATNGVEGPAVAFAFAFTFVFVLAVVLDFALKFHPATPPAFSTRKGSTSVVPQLAQNEREGASAPDGPA